MIESLALFKEEPDRVVRSVRMDVEEVMLCLFGL
jgi:hypothetical protein